MLTLSYLVICAAAYFGLRQTWKNDTVKALAAMPRAAYYVMAFSWGLPLTLGGLAAAVVLMIRGHKPKRFGYNWFFELDDISGGLNLGVICVVPKDCSLHMQQHEHGHGIQNAYLGPFMIGIVCLPSVTRYWLRRWKQKKHIELTTAYDDIWFEGQATLTGKVFTE